jgi:acyl-CoA thioesterase I
MFELPLPLMCNEYSRVQWEQAFRHHVALAPKRVLMAVLSAGDATDDSSHLTQAGHERLADLVSGMIR